MSKYDVGFVDSKVRFLFEQAKKRAPVRMPVELVRLAVIQRVCHLDVRPMLPTGGLACLPNGFAVYIRDLHLAEPKALPLDPGAPEPALSPRQRFTLAHEIAHTLFFDSSAPPQELAGAPGGKALESLCQFGARRLLLPEGLINPLVNKGQPITAELVRSISDRFQASPEVVIRRLDESDVVEFCGASLLMVRSGLEDTEPRVIAVRYDLSLAPHRSRPKLFSGFSTWSAGLLPEEFWQSPIWSGAVAVDRASLNIRKTPYGGRSFFVEIDVHPEM